MTLTFRFSALAALLLLGAAGCGRDDFTPGTAVPDRPAGAYGPSGRPGAAGVSSQSAFLARIKGAAVGNGVIQDARMNGDSELGVVLGRQVKLSQVDDIMKKLLKEMRDEFPGRQLTVIAYAPAGQPMATMRYDPAAPPNANVTYTPNF